VRQWREAQGSRCRIPDRSSPPPQGRHPGPDREVQVEPGAEDPAAQGQGDHGAVRRAEDARGGAGPGLRQPVRGVNRGFAALDAELQAQLLRYLEELRRWNKAYNLTAIRAPG